VIRHLPLLFAALLAVLLALAFARWAFIPARYVPRFRIATMRLRLRLHLHPGRGFATLAELWLGWGRFASFRESGRTRPALPRSQRIVRPASHSVYLGRAQYRHRLQMSIQENITVVGIPRSGKSGWLAKVIIRFGGAVVATSTKADMFKLTSGLRSRRGRPVFTFNPLRIGGAVARSSVWFDPIPGCQDEAVAMRRGTAFAEAVRTAGTESGGFWSEQAALQLPALFCAAALGDLDLRDVTRWVLSGDTRQPERLLRGNGRGSWADSVAQMRGPADKTAATVRMVLTAALKFMNDPALTSCALPGPGPGFNIGEFLQAQGTLYLIAEQRGETSPLAALFACMVTEIHWEASQIGSALPGGRLDPPLLLALDEVTQIVPVPVPSLLADSGGRGIMMIVACHGLAQLEDRWGKAAARSILDTSNQLFVAGTKDPETLRMVSDLCGDAHWRERGDGKMASHPVATPAMVRGLPRRRALVLRGSAAPVVTHLPMVWNDWRYRLACLQGRDVVDLTAPTAAPRTVPVMAVPVPLPIPQTAPAELARVGANGTGRALSNGHSKPAARYPWDKR
jgi:type IV secretion system protein VirD4